MSYKREENGFLAVEDFPKAQNLKDEQLRYSWTEALKLIGLKLNPIHQQIFHLYPVDCYWSVHQSDWATDMLFSSSRTLSEIYPQLVQTGIVTFCSADVMRFIGKRLHGNYADELASDHKSRPEGLWIKHRAGVNSVKMYHKRGRILRIETTLNDPKPFKVFRPLEGDPQGPRAWRPMRRGVADLPRRARISQASNERYPDGLAGLNTDSPILKLIDPACRPILWKGRRRRASARVTRKIRLLRAHGIIRKVAHTHRYVLTKKGRAINSAILKYQNMTLQQLEKAAA